MWVNQRTISKECIFKGKGLHTGLDVTIKLIPAPQNSGIVFRRIDLDGFPEVRAIAENVVSTGRSTVIGLGEVQISTIEHLMSALFGYGIDNLRIDIDGPEVPILAGNAKPYTDAFASIVVEFDCKRPIFKVSKKLYYKDEKSGSEITIYPDDKLSIDLMIDFNIDIPGKQYAHYNDCTDYAKEIAPSRTFVFVSELEPLLKNNLIKGGDLDNALVIAESDLSGEYIEYLGKLFGIEGMGSVKKGYVNGGDEAEFNNECARHKLLDLIGDLSLAGLFFTGKVVVSKPGHNVNTIAAKMIRENYKESQSSPTIPMYDPEAEPVVDVNGIKKLLPHRPPFLMVDRIMEMSKERVIGIKTIGVNEGFFIGHFPEEPVMPGVLIIETMAQVGGILVLTDLDEPEKYSTYLVKIDNAKFKRKVVPGDVLVIVMTITTPLRRSIVSMKGEVYVGKSLACSADMVAQVIKNK
jgi:UDP-3-O-acyl-N-acetylglucosamine deacetylase